MERERPPPTPSEDFYLNYDDEEPKLRKLPINPFARCQQLLNQRQLRSLDQPVTEKYISGTGISNETISEDATSTAFLEFKDKIEAGLPNLQAMNPLARPSTPQNELWPVSTETVVKVSGLHVNTTTWRVAEAFAGHGDILSIQILRMSTVEHPGLAAKIVFSPCPSMWELQCGASRLTALGLPPAPNSVVRPAVQVLEHRVSRTQSRVRSDKSFHERMVLKAGAVGFGFQYEPQHICIMEISHTSPPFTDTLLTLNLQRRELVLKFAFEDSESEKWFYKLQMPLTHVKEILEIRQSPKSLPSLLISLGTAPAVYRRRQCAQEAHVRSAYIWHEHQQWQRVPSIDVQTDSPTGPISLSGTDGKINIANWTTYNVPLCLESRDLCIIDDFAEALAEYSLIIRRATTGLRISYSTIPSCWQWMQSAATEWTDSTVQLSWPVRYQLEVCISQGILSEYNISKTFVHRLLELSEDAAVRLLEHIADMPVHIYEPMCILHSTKPDLSKTAKVPSYCVLIRQATVTPSTIYFSTPTVEVSNRVLRQFSEYSDRFLKVRFADEKIEGRLRASENGSMDPLYDRVKRCLTDGIVIGSRKFEYLASGNSQFREHGAYFFNSTAALTADDIRSWIGDFRDLKVVSKYMSRMGQGFSTTRAIKGTRVVIKEDKDIVHNAYNFTDGVGKISKFLAQTIAIELGLPDWMSPPSAYQFRLGGCKGVLALSPDVKGREIHIRPSQYKFPAIHEGLEIIRYSSFACLELNRQLITCLNTRGVPNKTFLDLLYKQLYELTEAMRNSDMALAVLAKRQDPNRMTLELAELIKHGFVAAKDPFVVSMLQLWRSWSLKKLKEKARITVDQSAFLLGCVDETGILKGQFKHDNTFTVLLDATNNKVAGLPQIFVQVPCQELNGAFKVITGPCIVARNPCLHPGDIRVVNAIDVPRLHHLQNVVVFPQNGDRDLPSMCSGGDLDGDDFLVSWNPDLIPPQHQWNKAAMNFDSARPITKAKVSTDDCVDFFVNHMKYDNLGRIANAWLAIADASPRRATDLRCLELAELHSIAVDFPKTGVPAQIACDLIPKQYPHFMAGKYRRPHQICRSKSVLGQIYDAVQGEEFKPCIKTGTYDPRILNAFIEIPGTIDPLYVLDNAAFPEMEPGKCPGNPSVLRACMAAQAIQIKEEYDANMRRIMLQHGIATEAEVWTTFVLSHNHASGDYKFHETMSELVNSLKDRYRRACVEANDETISCTGGRSSSELAGETSNTQKASSTFASDSYERMAPFVQIMYQITHDEVETYHTLHLDDVSRQIVPMMSFPWLFSDMLCRIAREASQPDTSTDASDEFVEVDEAKTSSDSSADVVIPFAPTLSQLGLPRFPPFRTVHHRAKLSEKDIEEIAAGKRWIPREEGDADGDSLHPTTKGTLSARLEATSKGQANKHGVKNDAPNTLNELQQPEMSTTSEWGPFFPVDDEMTNENDENAKFDLPIRPKAMQTSYPVELGSGKSAEAQEESGILVDLSDTKKPYDQDCDDTRTKYRGDLLELFATPTSTRYGSDTAFHAINTGQNTGLSPKTVHEK